jgi:hypothetical protein
MYRITWLMRQPDGLTLYTMTTPSAVVACTVYTALRLRRSVIAPRLWTRNNGLIRA